MLEIQSQVTCERLAPLASFGPSTRWMSPPRKKSCLRACTTPTALPHPTPSHPPPPPKKKLYIFQLFTSSLFFNLFHGFVFLENFGAKLFSQLFVSSGH